jgi:hypothetical protein
MRLLVRNRQQRRILAFLQHPLPVPVADLIEMLQTVRAVGCCWLIRSRWVVGDSATARSVLKDLAYSISDLRCYQSSLVGLFSGCQ